MAKKVKELEHVYVPNRQAWREWLAEHHQNSPGIWLIYYKKESEKSRVAYDEAVEEALCYGWIDSTVNKIDELCFKQLFTPRKAKSTWSKINKVRVEKLHAAGLMSAAGLACIEVAKQNGYWEILDDIEELLMPSDLAEALPLAPNAAQHFNAFSKSVKKAIYWWIISARRPETRQQRIEKTVKMAAENKRAQFDK